MSAFTFRAPSKSEILLAFTSHYDRMAIAGKQTMIQAAEIAKQKGRASIRAGGPGFQRRWPNALRADVYPKGQNSANAAALIYIRSTYAGIFEDGGTVRPSGKSLLWLPLQDTPKRVDGKKVTPALLSKSLGRPLTYMARPGKMPLLVTFVRVGAKSLTGKVTRGQLERGIDTKGKKKVLKMVPLFVGLRTVNIPKKWAIREAAAAAVAQVPNIFVQQLRRVRGR